MDRIARTCDTELFKTMSRDRNYRLEAIAKHCRGGEGGGERRGKDDRKNTLTLLHEKVGVE
jgi:hypothetical protein